MTSIEARLQAHAVELLAANPQHRIAVVAQYDEPYAHICVATRGVGVCGIDMPAETFDAFALAEFTRERGGKFMLGS